MVKDYDFIIYLNEDWEIFTSRQYLIGVLAKRLPSSKLLCINRPVCLMTTPLKKPRKFATWLGGLAKLSRMAENLFLFQPFVLLHDHLAAKLPPLPWVNRVLLCWQLRRASHYLNLKRDKLISWIWDPMQREYLGLVEEKLSIWESYHEYPALPQRSIFRKTEDLLRREQDILKQVDIVFVNSKAHIARKSKFHGNIHVLPEASPESFSLIGEQDAPAAADVAALPSPVVGLVGYLTSRIDFALLKHLASRHNEWSLAWIGSTAAAECELSRRQDFVDLKRMPNIYLLPARPLEELIHGIRGFDVCIIPYVLDDMNLHCSPVKLYMYLATGRPIVSVNIPGVADFREVIRVAKDHVEFEHLVAEALEEDDEPLRRKRMGLARENTWEKRAETIVSIINRTLALKQHHQVTEVMDP